MLVALTHFHPSLIFAVKSKSQSFERSLTVKIKARVEVGDSDKHSIYNGTELITAVKSFMVTVC